MGEQGRTREKVFVGLLAISRVAGICARHRLFRSTSFCLRSKRGIKVVNVGKAKGSALLGVVTKLRRPSTKGIMQTGRLIVHCLPRVPRFSPRGKTLRGMLSCTRVKDIRRRRSQRRRRG